MEEKEKKKKQILKLGVTDSGIGGFSWMRQLLKQGITVPVVYVSDAKYMPYGDLTPEEMQDRVTKLVDFCFDQGCDAVVLACNSASSALPATKYGDDPRVVGLIEPTIRHLKSQQASDLHIIATESTIALGLHKRGLSSIVASVCSSKELATIVERGDGPMSEDAKEALAECLATATEQKQLLLACTHYEIMPQETIYQHMPLLEKIWLPCEATLEEVRKYWSFAEGDGTIEVFCSNPGPEQHERVLRLFGVNCPPFKDSRIS